MTNCWSEGALRAYLDRELSPEEIQAATAHLRECPSCDSLCKGLAARAARVAELVDLLPEPEAETIQVPLRAPHKSVVHIRAAWVGAAVALAAGLALAAYFAPRRPTPQVPIVLTPTPTPVAETKREVQPEVVQDVPVARVRPARNRARQASTAVPYAGEFVVLDDEPFESGVIMRVEIKPGKTQADIVFGPDGRARALRLIKSEQQKY
jgi:hypothetical protein